MLLLSNKSKKESMKVEWDMPNLRSLIKTGIGVKRIAIEVRTVTKENLKRKGTVTV
jgi:hypothetical protein